MTAPDLSTLYNYLGGLPQQAPQPGANPPPQGLPTPAPNLSTLAQVALTPGASLKNIASAYNAVPEQTRQRAVAAAAGGVLPGNAALQHVAQTMPGTPPPTAPAGPPGALDPSQIQFNAQPAQKPGPNPLAGLGGTAKVAATDTPLINPRAITGIEGAQADEADAETRMANLKQQEQVTAAIASNEQAQLQLRQAHETRQAAEEHDKYVQGQTEKLAGLQKDLDTSSIDPEHWSKSLSTVDHIRYTVASIFGAFGAALTHTPDGVAEAINGKIARDLMAQKEAIERKKGAVTGQQGILAEAYRRFGNMDQAMNASHVLALQMAASEASARAGQIGTDEAAAANDIFQAKNRQEQKRGIAALYHYTPAHTVATGPAMPTLKEYNAAQESFAKEHPGESFPTYQEWAPSRMGLGGMAPGAPKAGASGEKEADQARSYDAALHNLYQIRDMIQSGGEFSKERTAKGESLVGGASNAIARAETGGTRAPSEGEMNIIRQQIPSDPNALQFTGADLAKINTTIEQTEAARARLKGAPPPEKKGYQITPVGK